jgi:hypothetical protein
MRRGLFILAVFILMAMSSRDAHAVLLFGTKDKVEHLQDLNAKGPNGEALYLGYLVSTHSFMLPYSMSGDYVLVVRGARDIFYKLPQEKIEQCSVPAHCPIRFRSTGTRSAITSWAIRCG